MEDPLNSPPMASSGYSILPSSQQYGFMELLGLQDSIPYHFDDSTSLLDGILPLHQVPPPVMFSAAAEPSPKVANHPANPNGSSSISSSTSTEAAVVAATDAEVQVKAAEEVGEKGEDEKEEEEEEDQKTQKKVLEGSKRAKEKKQRVPRIAFMTKTEIDHLEDGYRWRKYGQKAVKNSPFPRSYYRCTSASCNVKKRVERSHTDPTTVVTTYEGHHTHPSPLLAPRYAAFMMPPPEYSAFSGMGLTVFPLDPNDLINRGSHQQWGPYYSSLVGNELSSGKSLPGSTSAAAVEKRRFCPRQSSATAGDHGLLEDVILAHVLKEEQ